MHRVEVKETIDAPAEEVWNIAGDFSGLDQFVEAITDCKSEGSGVGAIRTLTLQDGGKVKEKLESLDNDKYQLTYTILDSPLPIKDYTGTIQVNSIDDSTSEFIWSSSFNAADEVAGDMKEALSGLYKVGADGLKSKF